MEIKRERERYVLEANGYWFNAEPGTKETHTMWESVWDDARRFESLEKALQAIEWYGQRFHGNGYQRDWSIWTVLETQPAAWDAQLVKRINVSP